MWQHSITVTREIILLRIKVTTNAFHVFVYTFFSHFSEALGRGIDGNALVVGFHFLKGKTLFTELLVPLLLFKEMFYKNFYRVTAFKILYSRMDL